MPHQTAGMNLRNRVIAELFGTFCLVFAGLGGAVFAGSKIGNLGISLAFGLALLTMAYTIGPISGCHINPAVTVGALLARKINGRDAVSYIAAQVAGAIIASGLVLLVANGAVGGYEVLQDGLGANGFGAHSPGGYSMGAAFVAEIVLTMFLVITVLGSTDIEAPVGFAGIAIGLMLTVINLVGIPITNASFNPARSIGPAVFVGSWAIGQLWLFIIAPIIGAVAAAAIYAMVHIKPAEVITTQVAEKALEEEQAQRRKERRIA